MPSFIGSLIHWISASLIQRLTDSYIHRRITVQSCIGLLAHRLTVHPCIDSLIHWITGSLSNWFIHSLVLCFIDSLNHCWVIGSSTHNFIHWLIRWFISSLNHSCIDSSFHRLIALLVYWILMHWMVYPLTHWFIDRWFTEALLHWFIDSLIQRSIGSLVGWFMGHCFIASLIHWFIDSVVHRFINSLVHPASCARSILCHSIRISTAISLFVDALHNFNHSWFLYLKTFPAGYWFLMVISYLSKFPPRHLVIQVL